jgi:hypothetical protein
MKYRLDITVDIRFDVAKVIVAITALISVLLL